jgi:hypothetical protein
MLYLQQLRGWSSLETGLAIFPDGFLGFALAFGPVNIAATAGVPPEEPASRVVS